MSDKSLPIRLAATLVLACVLSFFASAQSGTVRGTVIEDETGEALPGAAVVVAGTTNGRMTDLDGKFELKLAPGIYDLQVSYISYETVTITGVTIESDKVFLLNGIRMKSSGGISLGGVTVTADVVRRSEAALLTVKKAAANMIDGISSEKLEKTGDSDAAGAVRRVTGVSVEGGKYIYVRGLGDRYAKTMLNNIDIPGLDPDRNSIQMDIFPVSLIDNVTVMKSFIAELPADFTGGIVNIETKDFPDKQIFSISAGMGYNPDQHFNSRYLTGNRGGKDFLGFDDGSRALPAEARKDPIPSPLNGTDNEETNAFLKKFNPSLAAVRQTSVMDYGFGISLGNQFALKRDRKLGYILSATYKNSTKFYEDVVYGEYQRVLDPSVYELRYATIQSGAIGENSVLLGGLGGLALKTGNSKIKLTMMHLQSGESRAGRFLIDNDGAAVGQSGYIASSDNLEYNQRGLTNILLNGKHRTKKGTWTVDWRISPTISDFTDPDIRKTAFTMTATDTSFVAGAGGNPSRIWRYLDELNLVGKMDITRGFEFLGSPASVKFGASHTYKDRNYEILSYDLQFFGSQPDFGMNPDNILTNDNLYPNGTLYYSSGNNNPNPNAYQSNINNTGIYVSGEFNPITRLKTIIGLRGEIYVQRHTGRDVAYASFGVGKHLDNDKVLDALDMFPSINIIYSVNDTQDLRVSYSRSIARPSFKELSFAQILDPITNRIFNGSLFTYSDWDGKLSETRIDNFDVRWELFIDRDQLASISVFYKMFDKPIELVRIPEQQTSTEYQPRNVGDGRLLGLEAELRKSLRFLFRGLKNYGISGNLTYVWSEIDMTDAEYNSRKSYEKQGETIRNTRRMLGQAPYIVNMGVSYENAEDEFDVGFYYNVKGPTLIFVGSGLFPDVYSRPFHSLNFNLNKSFGSNKRSSFNISISNILNDIREEVYTGFRAKEQYFSKFTPGTLIGIGLKHSFH